MEKLNKEEKEEILAIIKQQPLFRLIGLIQTIFLLMLIASPFTLMWIGWSISWKLALSGIIGILLMKLIYDIIFSFAEEKLDEECELINKIK